MIQKNIFNVEVLNARSIMFHAKTPLTKEWKDKKHIKKIELSNSTIFNLGDKIDVKINTNPEYNTYYTIKYIYKEDSQTVLINEFELNASSTYVLPLLNLKPDYLLLEENFINCYVKHYDFKSTLGEVVFLIYRYLPIKYYSQFVEAMKKQKGFSFYQKEVDNRFDCFMFKMPEQITHDIQQIMAGKFSSISEESKKKILFFHRQTNSDSPLYQILYKGELRRIELETALACYLPENLDYADKPDINKEEWRLLNIKKKENEPV